MPLIRAKDICGLVNSTARHSYSRPQPCQETFTPCTSSGRTHVNDWSNEETDEPLLAEPAILTRSKKWNRDSTGPAKFSGRGPGVGRPAAIRSVSVRGTRSVAARRVTITTARKRPIGRGRLSKVFSPSRTWPKRREFVLSPPFDSGRIRRGARSRLCLWHNREELFPWDAPNTMDRR
jgi:hypothetical protein